MRKVRVLFVCMGNICRSPTAEGVFTRYVMEAGLKDAFEIDSAGTHGYHEGASADRRAQQAARSRGVDLSTLRARRVYPRDLDYFDHVLAMDYANLEDLHALCSPDQRSKVELFLDYARGIQERQVPDPYYGGSKGFEYVLDLAENAAQGLLESLIERHGVIKKA